MSYDYILHVSDVARWPAALSNLGNLTQLGLAHGITVIVNGTGVYALQGANDWTAQMEAAAGAGVDFFACSRSLANHEFVEGTLPEWLGQVPAANPRNPRVDEGRGHVHQAVTGSGHRTESLSPAHHHPTGDTRPHFLYTVLYIGEQRSTP